MCLFKLLGDCCTTLYNENSLSWITTILNGILFYKRIKNRSQEIWSCLCLECTRYIYIYCDSEESYSLPQDTEVIKSSFTVSLFWSRLGQSHNQNSQQFAEAQSTKRPTINLFFNRTHRYIWNNKPAPITSMKTLQTFQWKITRSSVCHFLLDIFLSLYNN